ncbi:GNAT family N-acetyltransferase [Streptomyces tropicalis]|uniref:GNAT family N-acetyltransferase n=1 Tax=Streptomyces tropicalis TaxID=3034234 RepID=A0ABT6A762_9ACTN|nr:GNAT family N-acetyltransferase [Streptomyces tropicalis]MDF3300476.1 GNAT family N-acetyltransferase [Streptomyces tropicalis]
MRTTIRQGGPDDIPLILGMLDSCVAWLVAQGRTRQWGTEPWSENPRAVDQVTRYATGGTPWIAELDGVPAATLTLTDGPGSYVAPAGEPERYIHLLASDRRFAGHGAGGALLAHAAAETARAGVSLLRVDCYAGDDRRLITYYEGQGFTPTESLALGPDAWPCQVLMRRV